MFAGIKVTKQKTRKTHKTQNTLSYRLQLCLSYVTYPFRNLKREYQSSYTSYCRLLQYQPRNAKHVRCFCSRLFVFLIPLPLTSVASQYSLCYESAAGVLCVAPCCPITGVSIELFRTCKYFNNILGKQTTDFLNFLSLTSKSMYCKIMTMMMEAVRRSERSELWITKRGNVCRKVILWRVRLTTIAVEKL